MYIDCSHTFSGGKASAKLTYYDGFINLTYTDGDLYRGTPPIARSTQIAFLCDPAAGKGRPEFLGETNHMYSFQWFTSYACPERAVECAVVNANKQYDLSRSVSRCRLGRRGRLKHLALFFIGLAKKDFVSHRCAYHLLQPCLGHLLGFADFVSQQKSLIT